MVLVDELTEYSRQFAEYAFRKKPDWQSRAQVYEHIVGGPGFLRIEFAPPNLRATHPLTIEVEIDDVVVAFDDYHCHFDREECGSNEEVFAAAIKAAEQIMAGHIRVVRWEHGSEFLASSWVEGDEQPDPRLPGDCQPDRLVYRSWDGSRDDVVKVGT